MEFTCQYTAPTPATQREELLAAHGFGRVFTDHMITIEWSESAGWHDAQLRPYGPLTLDPSCQVFHYGQEVFEAVKAYRRSDGSIAAFRPDAHAQRLARSCERMAMPILPADIFLQSLELLIGVDAEWVPESAGHSLYLRPFLIATQPSLGFYRRSTDYLFVVLASPAGGYFSGNGVRPVSVWLSTDHVRAAPGGTGAAKCGGNYAGSLLAQEQALEQGCDQVVWLDAIEHRWVEELGTSNVFFVFDTTVITPPLSDTMLAGVTRDSILTLAPDLGYSVAERTVSVQEWRSSAESGALTETFSCGTSAMITPIATVKGAAGQWTVGQEGFGPVTSRLREELTGIQSGHRPDRYGWMHEVEATQRAVRA